MQSAIAVRTAWNGEGTLAKMTPSYLKARDDWVKETQMFQRIAKVPEISKEELEKDYDKFCEDRIKGRGDLG